MKENEPIVLILCGGRSLRLWPLSEYKSKNFIDIFGFSPLEVTFKRFLKITSRKNIYLVASHSEKKYLSKLQFLDKENIIYEPSSKNTAAAILLSLCSIKRPAESVLIVSPVDHYIKQESKFFLALKKTIAAASAGYICTLGVKPLEPSPHFGYIQVGSKKDKAIYSVVRFIEKPSVNQAKKLISKGSVFYNSGMFISTIDTLKEEFKRYYPFYEGFLKAVSKLKVKALYSKLKDIPFDKAIMEKSRKICLVKADFFWKDFGSWHTVYELLSKDKAGNATKGQVAALKSGNNCFYLDNPNKKMLAIGLEDVFFVDTESYCLLINRENIDGLKSFLKEFKN